MRGSAAAGVRVGELPDRGSVIANHLRGVTSAVPRTGSAGFSERTDDNCVWTAGERICAERLRCAA